ncbi:hypothetical protein ACFT9I_19260 [Streptomyces sp. NPDC057137]|uniref:hypothetical protein n=1 Tax=Streptomyces sp. NPDC057137 TaxID=3346030 RepID=UPI00362D7D1A
MLLRISGILADTVEPLLRVEEQTVDVLAEKFGVRAAHSPLGAVWGPTILGRIKGQGC